jgi:uncharacterized glyoxalase superfamily protein PhnB
MTHLDAYLFFDGNCAEAMRFGTPWMVNVNAPAGDKP